MYITRRLTLNCDPGRTGTRVDGGVEPPAKLSTMRFRSSGSPSSGLIKPPGSWFLAILVYSFSQ